MNSIMLFYNVAKAIMTKNYHGYLYAYFSNSPFDSIDFSFSGINIFEHP